MKTRSFIFILLVILPLLATAEYDPHDGSNYSCNELRNNAYYAKTHCEQNVVTAILKYIDYCPEQYMREQIDDKELIKASSRIACKIAPTQYELSEKK